MRHLGPFVIQREAERVTALEAIRDHARAEGRERLAEAEQEIARLRAEHESEVADLQERVAVARQEADLLRAERDRLRGLRVGLLAFPVGSWN